MSKLNAAARNRIPPSQVNKGKLSSSEAAKIRRKANAILGEK